MRIHNFMKRRRNDWAEVRTVAAKEEEASWQRTKDGRLSHLALWGIVGLAILLGFLMFWPR
jgi:hypothetical protein